MSIPPTATKNDPEAAVVHDNPIRAFLFPLQQPLDRAVRHRVLHPHLEEEADLLKETYNASRPVLALLMVDNYEDIMKSCADTQRSAILARPRIFSSRDWAALRS